MDIAHVPNSFCGIQPMGCFGCVNDSWPPSGNQTWQWKIPLWMEVLIGKSPMNGSFSSTPCLITRRFLLANHGCNQFIPVTWSATGILLHQGSYQYPKSSAPRMKVKHCETRIDKTTNRGTIKCSCRILSPFWGHPLNSAVLQTLCDSIILFTS